MSHLVMEPEKTVTEYAVLQNLIAQHGAEFIDLRFSDTLGQEQHLSLAVSQVNEALFREGKAFDGSSIAGWKSIDQSDMILKPEIKTARLDPFYQHPTLSIRCNVIEPSTQQPYSRCPRSLAQRAEAYLCETEVAEVCYVGPEPEFFIFDDVRWSLGIDQVSFQVDSKEGAWNSSKVYPEGNLGHRPSVKGGYFPVPPVDACQDIRSEMCRTLTQMGYEVEVHHHEVATASQNEIGTRYAGLCQKADEVQALKYVVHNVAHAFGKTATFMPKPLAGDNGSGMHCHLSLEKNGENCFVGEAYAGLSDTAMYFIGGILKHARALNALTNPGTNSYKRLLPGFEAPVLLTYSAGNRSAAIRIPYVTQAKARRIEARFPDPLANPYLAFSALLMAGLDGVLTKTEPGDAMDQNLYDLSNKADIPCVCGSLSEALDELEKDHDFLLAGQVFSTEMLEAYVRLKRKEVARLNRLTHPVEFEMYYSV